jgi:hypothetical protein
LLGLFDPCESGACTPQEELSMMSQNIETCGINLPQNDDISGLAAIYTSDFSFSCQQEDLTVFCSVVEGEVGPRWDWGDGQQSTGASSSHRYADYGQYLVQACLSPEDCDTPVCKEIFIYLPAPEDQENGKSCSSGASGLLLFMFLFRRSAATSEMPHPYAPDHAR